MAIDQGREQSRPYSFDVMVNPPTEADLDRIISVANATFATPYTVIAVMLPSFEPMTELPESLNNMSWPDHTKTIFCNVSGEGNIGHIRQLMAEQALMLEAKYAVFLDDDVYPPPETFLKLFEIIRLADGKAIAAADYDRRNAPHSYSTTSVVRNGEVQPLVRDGTVQEAHLLALGCAVIPTAVFKQLEPPWFFLGPTGEDTYFSTRVRTETDFKLLCDSSIHCEHRDRGPRIRQVEIG